MSNDIIFDILIQPDSRPSFQQPYIQSRSGLTRSPEAQETWQETAPETSQQVAATDDSIPTTLFKKLSESSHPMALLSYLIFRICPLTFYLFGLLFTSNYILNFILIMLLLAADFWNIKNISGRLLVGLRWWNESNELGQSIWVFETSDPNRYINPIDSKVFWALLYIAPCLWVVLGFVAVLKLQFFSLILVIVAIILTTINSMAYTKCDKLGKANTFTNNIFGNVTGSILNRMNPFTNVMSN